MDTQTASEIPSDSILLVDDEESILSSLKRLLRKEGYNIFSTTSPDEGLEILRREAVALIISDQRMPEMDGTEFLAKARELQPNAVRVILTGYADINAAIAAINQGQVYRFITKPWDDLDIRATIKQAVDLANLKKENKRLFELSVRQNAELKEWNENLEKKVQERTNEIAQKNLELDRLYKELSNSYFKTIRIFVELMEIYDPSLGGHSKRVAALARAIAKKCRLPEAELDNIETAGYLHDIGLIGIPRAVAKKQNRTSAEEALYKQHPTLGYTILNAIPHLDHVSVLVKSHHERFNGSGYPDRLREEEIPLGARIVSVANAYDHLLSRKDLSKDDIPLWLKRLAKDELDPELISMAIDLLASIRKSTATEISITLDQLRPNMVLSRELRTHSGRLLMPKDAVLKEAYLEKLRRFHDIDPIVGWIYVYK